MAVYQFKSSTSYSGIPNHIIEERQDVIFRRVRGILNKITPETFDKLSKELVNVGLDSPRTLRGVIYLLFDKALKDLKYSSLYAKLCQELSEKAPNFEQEPGPNTFCKFLISKCEDEFERRRKATEDFDSKNELTDEEYEQKAIVKQKMLGNIKFICELGKKRLLQEEILHECIRGLLSKKRERPIQDQAQDLECLCQIMRTIGSLLDIKASKNLMNQYFERIDMFSRKSELPSRIRFMLRDVIDLRNNNWRPRPFQREDNVPQTLSKLREEAGFDPNTNSTVDKFGNTRNLGIGDLSKLHGNKLAMLLDDEPSFTTSADYHWGSAFLPNDNPFDAFTSSTKDAIIKKPILQQQNAGQSSAVFSSSANSAFTSINTITPTSNAPIINSTSSAPIANFHRPYPFPYKDPFSPEQENNGQRGFDNKQTIRLLDSYIAAKQAAEITNIEVPNLEKVSVHDTSSNIIRNVPELSNSNMTRNKVSVVNYPRTYHREQEKPLLNHQSVNEIAGPPRRFIDPRQPPVTARPGHISPNIKSPMKRHHLPEQNLPHSSNHQPNYRFESRNFGNGGDFTENRERRFNRNQNFHDFDNEQRPTRFFNNNHRQIRNERAPFRDHHYFDRSNQPESELNFNWRSGPITSTTKTLPASTVAPVSDAAIVPPPPPQVPNITSSTRISSVPVQLVNNSSTIRPKAPHAPIGSHRKLSPHFKEQSLEHRFESFSERSNNSINNNNNDINNPTKVLPNQFIDSEMKYISSSAERRSSIERSPVSLVLPVARQGCEIKGHQIASLKGQSSEINPQSNRTEKSNSLDRVDEPAREPHPPYHGRLSSPSRPSSHRRNLETGHKLPAPQIPPSHQFNRTHGNQDDSFDRREQQRLPYNRSYFQEHKEHHIQQPQTYRNQENEAHHQERNYRPQVNRNPIPMDNSNITESDRIPSWRRAIPATLSSSANNNGSNNNGSGPAIRDHLPIINNPVLPKPITKISDKNFSLRPSHNLIGRTTLALQTSKSSTTKTEPSSSETNTVKEAQEQLDNMKINLKPSSNNSQGSQQTTYTSGINSDKENEISNAPNSNLNRTQASEFHVNKFISILAEFCNELNTSNVTRIASKIKELKIPKSYQHECLISAMKQSILRSEIDRDNVGKLFVHIMPTIFDTSALIKAYKLIFEQMKGMEVETPKVKSLVAEFMSRTILDGLLTLEEVGGVLSGGKHHPLFLLILQKLEKSAGQAWLTEKFIWSKINLISMLPEVDQSKDRLASILKDRSLGFLDPMLTIEPDLWEQLKERDSSPAAVYRWIKENVSQNIQETPTFAHVLITCLMKYIHGSAVEKCKFVVADQKDDDLGSTESATLTESNKSSPTSASQSTSDIEKELLTKYQQVLQAILKDKRMQLATLYALQAFYHDLDFPKGSLLRWFHMLYDMNIVDDDVFFTWKEEINDEIPGKGQALFQVNNWFNWLAEAESEEEEDV